MLMMKYGSSPRDARARQVAALEDDDRVVVARRRGSRSRCRRRPGTAAAPAAAGSQLTTRTSLPERAQRGGQRHLRPDRVAVRLGVRRDEERLPAAGSRSRIAAEDARRSVVVAARGHGSSSGLARPRPRGSPGAAARRGPASRPTCRRGTRASGRAAGAGAGRSGAAGTAPPAAAPWRWRGARLSVPSVV